MTRLLRNDISKNVAFHSTKRERGFRGPRGDDRELAVHRHINQIRDPRDERERENEKERNIRARGMSRMFEDGIRISGSIWRFRCGPFLRTWCYLFLRHVLFCVDPAKTLPAFFSPELDEFYQHFNGFGHLFEAGPFQRRMRIMFACR